MRYLMMLLGLVVLSGEAPASDRDQPVDIQAGRTLLDNRGEGYYELTEGVSLTQGSLVIKAEQAKVFGQFGRNPERVHVQGTPATMQQAIEGQPGLVYAEALNMEFYRERDMVILTGEVLITQNRGEMRAERVVYHIADGRIESDGTTEDRVRMRIEPEVHDQGPD